MTEANNELDRLLDASVHRIGNEPGDTGSFDDIEDTQTPDDKDAPQQDA